MRRYRFWFDDTNFGIGIGNNAIEAFKFFKDLGFDEDDIIKFEFEVVANN